jgi:hypothetical protein
MSIISALQTYLASYAELPAGAPLWVGYLGPRAAEYSVAASPGARVIERYVNGGAKCEYNFTLQSTESTADELARIDAEEFYEAFAEWLDTQTEAGVFPALDAKKDVERIEALGWGFVIEQGQSGKAIHQVQCKLTYFQNT